MECSKNLELQELDFEELKELLEQETDCASSVSWGDH